MKIRLKRLRNNGDTTIGKITSSYIYEANTLEDGPREKKVKGKTRIPAGIYEVKTRKVLSPLTKRYRQRFPWFKWHLHLQNVPDFSYVYIHVGNDDDDTDGCILVGHKEGNWRIWESTQAFRDIYFYIVGALENGKVFIEIEDE